MDLFFFVVRLKHRKRGARRYLYMTVPCGMAARARALRAACGVGHVAKGALVVPPSDLAAFVSWAFNGESPEELYAALLDVQDQDRGAVGALNDAVERALRCWAECVEGGPITNG